MTAPLELAPGLTVGAGHPPLLIAGPCVLEGEASLDVARRIADELADLPVSWVFKASFDKANRTSAAGGRGLGVEAGLEMLGRIREELGRPVLTDVHLPEQCAAAAAVVDILQIPAFLCRQTDLLEAAAATGKAVNIKKGQFLAPADLQHAVGKVTGAGNPRVLLTERGASFGYGRLVVDFASLPELRASGHPLVLDATHAVQQPGSGSGSTGGDWRRAPLLMRAAAALGFDGMFVETHPNPLSSPSDGPNMIPLDELRAVLGTVLPMWELGRAAD
jgi:2-dehydro-3-deoxyphosphooctonate aldolase (KDO 8-P synthase)